MSGRREAITLGKMRFREVAGANTLGKMRFRAEDLNNASYSDRGRDMLCYVMVCYVMVCLNK